MNQLISTSWSRCRGAYHSPLKITSDKFKDLQFLKQVILPSCVLWQSHSLIKHVQSSWANSLLFEHSLLYDFCYSNDFVTTIMSLCRQIVLDRYIENLYFWADKLVIYNQIIMHYYYLTEWPVITDFINLTTRPELFECFLYLCD